MTRGSNAQHKRPQVLAERAAHQSALLKPYAVGGPLRNAQALTGTLSF